MQKVVVFSGLELCWEALPLQREHYFQGFGYLGNLLNKTIKNDPKTNPKVDDGKRLDSPSLDVVSGKCGVSKRGGSSRGERALRSGPAGGWRMTGSAVKCFEHERSGPLYFKCPTLHIRVI